MSGQTRASSGGEPLGRAVGTPGTLLTSPSGRIPREQYSEPSKLLLPYSKGFYELFIGTERVACKVINIRTVAEQTVRHGW